MRRSHLLAALAAFVLCSGVLAVAQQPGARPAAPPARPGPAIALLDVPKIFKQHAGFKHLMNNMKADAERDQTHLKAEREAIMKLAEQVKEYNRGTPDYKAGMETVTKRQADLAVKLRMHQETYREREAGIFYRVYTEMLEVVGYYAQANRITMVLKFNSETGDATQPETIVPYINRRVVWQAGNLDITQIILNEMNRRYGPAQPPVGTTDRRNYPGGTHGVRSQ